MQIKRIENEFADALATISSMIKNPNQNYINPFEIDLKEKHVHCFHVKAEPDGKPWYHNINKHMKSGFIHKMQHLIKRRQYIDWLAISFRVGKYIIGEL